MKLYDLTHNYQNLLELMDDETLPQEEITKALNGLSDDFDSKCENVAKVIKSMDADVKGLKDEEKRLANRRRSLENKCVSLKTYLSDSMKGVGKTKVKGSVITISFRNNAPSVNITDSDAFNCFDFYWTKQEPIINKTALLKDLKDGIKIPGAELIRNKSLHIK